MLIDSRIINEVDIKDLAERFLGIELRRKGREIYTFLCPNPMHNDTRVGNCNIVKRNGANYFHCFSCGAGGGPIDLVMYHEECDFVAAVKLIADWYGIQETKTEYKPASLTADEYKLLGLSSVVIDEYNVCFTLRDFMLESPEAHNQLVKARIRRTTNNLLTFLRLILAGEVPGIEPDPEWIPVVFNQIHRIEDLATKTENLVSAYKEKRSA